MKGNRVRGNEHASVVLKWPIDDDGVSEKEMWTKTLKVLNRPNQWKPINIGVWGQNMYGML